VADARHVLGVRAEEAVAEWLSRHGWIVLARRHRSKAGGEVDLIVLDTAGILVAVEVRARRSGRSGAPSATIDRRRIARLERTLTAFASTTSVSHRGLRVDLVAVEPSPDATQGAWRLSRTAGVGGW
jgi:putative endonuclease